MTGGAAVVGQGCQKDEPGGSPAVLVSCSSWRQLAWPDMAPAQPAWPLLPCRFTPLVVQGPEEALPSGLNDITAGDCVVAFSRNKLYQLKRAIETQTSNKVGARPSELVGSTRRMCGSSRAGGCWCCRATSLPSNASASWGLAEQHLGRPHQQPWAVNLQALHLQHFAGRTPPAACCLCRLTITAPVAAPRAGVHRVRRTAT